MMCTNFVEWDTENRTENFLNSVEKKKKSIFFVIKHNGVLPKTVMKLRLCVLMYRHMHEYILHVQTKIFAKF